MVDSATELGVERTDPVGIPGGSHAFDDAEQVTREADPLVERVVLRQIVLEQEADRQPVDLEVAILGDIDEPARRHPAERAGGIEPELDMGGGVRHGVVAHSANVADRRNVRQVAAPAVARPISSSTRERTARVANR